jgi:hypothetical protein
MSKYICPAKKKNSTIDNKLQETNNSIKKKKDFDIQENNFPELEKVNHVNQNKSNEKLETSNNLNVSDFQKLSFKSAIEKPIAEKKLQSSEANKNNKKKIIIPKIYFEERKYDNEGWMTNDDWIFHFEYFNPSLRGSF